jgi:acetyl-CoA synthetase
LCYCLIIRKYFYFNVLLIKRENSDRQSIENPAAFWQTEAQKYLTWLKDTLKADFANGNTKWFEGGQINACYNAVDRHAMKGSQAAII